jgi:hypothetical protein
MTDPLELAYEKALADEEATARPQPGTNRVYPSLRKGVVSAASPLMVDGLPASNLTGRPLTAATVVWLLIDAGRRLVVGIPGVEDLVTTTAMQTYIASLNHVTTSAMETYVAGQESGCTVSRTGDLSVASSGTPTVVTWSLSTTGTYQRNGTFDSSWSSGSGTELTIPSSLNGRYVQVGAKVGWASASGGRRLVTIYRNGAEFARTDAGLSGGAYLFGQEVTANPCPVATGTTFEVGVAQTSGGAINLLGGASLYGGSGLVSRFWLKTW